MSDADTSNELEQTLLTDDSKWWEFLDPDTYEVKGNLPTSTRSTSALIDWSKKRETQRRGPIGFGFFNRCDSCGNPSPPDFTFCPRCGGEPRGPSHQQVWTVVIKRLESEDAKQAAAELFAEGGAEIKVGEVYKMLGDLPAVFNIYERKERVAAVVQKLAEVGVYSKSFPVDDPSIPWIQETAESVLRDPKALSVFVLALGATIAAIAFWGWLWLIPGLLVLGFMGYRRFQWYQDHYRVNATPILDRLVGFDEGIAEESRMLLRRLVDKDMKNSLSLCIMEYYTLHQQFRAHEEAYGDVLLKSEHALKELMHQILSACRKYGDLDHYIRGIEPSEIRSRVHELTADLEGKDPRARELIEADIAHLKKEAAQYGKMTRLAVKFKDRMRAMTGSIEALRVRMQSLKTAEASWEEIPMEAILAELDDELEVFEKTFVAMEQR